MTADHRTDRNASEMGGARHQLSPAVRGFSVIELAVVLIILGLVIGPLLTLVGTQISPSRSQRTQEALQTAREALLAFAADHDGCLPFAADHEGGLPDTGADGTAGYTDTGELSSGKLANGDLPWATLGLGNDFLDGDSLRIQYYVASPYTDKDGNPSNGITCYASFRGFVWNNDDVAYSAPDNDSLYVYCENNATNVECDPDGVGERQLYRIKEGQTLPAGVHPAAADPLIIETIPRYPLPACLLAVVPGPEIDSDALEDCQEGDPEADDFVSVQNVFILIAAGSNRNAALDRKYVRDANHKNGDGTNWPLTTSANIDDKVFSAANDTSAADSEDHGDDTLVYMSFRDFKMVMGTYGMHMEPLCKEDAC